MHLLIIMVQLRRHFAAVLAIATALAFSLSLSVSPAADAIGPGTATRVGLPSSATLNASVHPRQAKSSRKTLFGSAVPLRLPGETVADAIKRQRAKFGSLDLIRVFYPGVPDPWSLITAAVGTTPVSVSFKMRPADVLAGQYDGFLTTWFTQAPTTRRTFWTYFHEPEDNIAAGEFTASAFRAAYAHIADLADAASNPDLRATLVLMCWTVDPRSHRVWRDYYPAGSVDVLAWDCYNLDISAGRYQSAASLLHAAVTTSQSVGLPWAVPELGSPLIAGDSGQRRAAWLKSLTDYASQYQARYVSYFDMNTDAVYELKDQPSIAQWTTSISH